MTNEMAITEDERALLRESVRGFLAEHWPVEGAVERANDAAAIAALWRKLAGQGLTRLGFDPEEGGLREILLAFEELGRASCPAPLLGAVVVNLAVRRGPGSTPLELMCEELHRGSATAAIALGAFDGDRAAGRAACSGDALNGRIAFVEGAASATHFVVFADAPSGLALVPAGANGITVIATPGLAVPALSELSFDGIAAPFINLPAPELKELAQVARVCYAARALGAAERGFELALAHAKTRRQFGQFIGQFQAIQHKLADCLIRLDGARLTLDAAASLFDQGRTDWRVFAAAAVAYAGPALRQLVLEAHHTMGAIGYAEEHEMPRHFRRIHADLARFGGAPAARAELADHLLGPRRSAR
jgi:alkylation response protein AidB-like acyl-CoA dehydrogenase